ncbi:hypothetical protein H9P43_002308 [Blastocladiella emersonii ATCC 22665]|nr:hypothetical protein H9P43_002308 [Blastocladiella emersonii ATCC 22665]
MALSIRLLSVVLAVLALALASAVAGQRPKWTPPTLDVPNPTDPFQLIENMDTSRNKFIVQFTRPPGVSAVGMPNAIRILNEVDDQHAAFVAHLKSANISARVLATFRDLLNGAAVEATTPQDAALLATAPGVRSMFPIAVHTLPKAETPANATTAPRTGSLDLSDTTDPTRERPAAKNVTDPVQAGLQAVHNLTRLAHARARFPHLDGRGVRIGIIDGTVDWRHPAFAVKGKRCTGPPGTDGCRVVSALDFSVEPSDQEKAAVAKRDADDGTSAAADRGARKKSMHHEPAVLTDAINPECDDGHATHVAGIAGGSDRFIDGVAPRVTIASYRAVNCKGRSNSAMVLAALERAYRDGMHVVSISLGGERVHRDYPEAQAVDRLARYGVLVVTGVGSTKGQGAYRVTSPAVAELGIAVTSFTNAVAVRHTANVTGVPDLKTLVLSWGTPGEFPPIGNNAPDNVRRGRPFAGPVLDPDEEDDNEAKTTSIKFNHTYMVKPGPKGDVTDGCDPFDPQYFAGAWAILNRGGCGVASKVLEAEAAMAKGVLIFNTKPNEELAPFVVKDAGIPHAFIDYDQGMALFRAAQRGLAAAIANQTAASTTTTTATTTLAPTATTVVVNGITTVIEPTPAPEQAPRRPRLSSGVYLSFNKRAALIPPKAPGQPSPMAPWGPDLNLFMRPDLAAIGDYLVGPYLLDRSPYAQLSGPSQAAAYLAGVLALDVQRSGGQRRPNDLAAVVRRLQITAQPARLAVAAAELFIKGKKLDAALLPAESVMRQGAGLVDVDAFLANRIDIAPSKLELGDAPGWPNADIKTATLRVRNSGDRTVTFDLTHEPARAVLPESGSTTAVISSSTFAPDVSFSPRSVTVAPGAVVVVTVTVNPNQAAPRPPGAPVSPRQPGVNEQWLTSGYIRFTPRDPAPDGSAAALHVPYSLMVGNYAAHPVLVHPPEDTSYLTHGRTDLFTQSVVTMFGPPNVYGMARFNLSRAHTQPKVVMSLAFPVRSHAVVLVNATDRTDIGLVGASHHSQPYVYMTGAWDGKVYATWDDGQRALDEIQPDDPNPWDPDAPAAPPTRSAPPTTPAEAVQRVPVPDGGPYFFEVRATLPSPLDKANRAAVPGVVEGAVVPLEKRLVEMWTSPPFYIKRNAPSVIIAPPGIDGEGDWPADNNPSPDFDVEPNPDEADDGGDGNGGKGKQKVKPDKPVDPSAPADGGRSGVAGGSGHESGSTGGSGGSNGGNSGTFSYYYPGVNGYNPDYEMDDQWPFNYAGKVPARIHPAHGGVDQFGRPLPKTAAVAHHQQQHHRGPRKCHPHKPKAKPAAAAATAVAERA